MAERGRAPAGRRVLPAPGRRAERRRPVASRRRALRRGRRSSRSCGNGSAPRPAPGACCRGCRSPSAPGSPAILPPNASRSCRLPRSRRSVLCAGGVPAAAAQAFPDRRDDRRRRRGLCGGDLENRAGRAWRAGAADVFGVDFGLCRNPRHPRAHRPLCPAGHLDGEPARPDKTRAGAAVGAQGHRARRRQFCRVEGAAAAADGAAAAGRLRFRPRHVFCRASAPPVL